MWVDEGVFAHEPGTTTTVNRNVIRLERSTAGLGTCWNAPLMGSAFWTCPTRLELRELHDTSDRVAHAVCLRIPSSHSESIVADWHPALLWRDEYTRIMISRRRESPSFRLHVRSSSTGMTIVAAQCCR